MGGPNCRNAEPEHDRWCPPTTTAQHAKPNPAQGRGRLPCCRRARPLDTHNKAAERRLRSWLGRVQGMTFRWLNLGRATMAPSTNQGRGGQPAPSATCRRAPPTCSCARHGDAPSSPRPCLHYPTVLSRTGPAGPHWAHAGRAATMGPGSPSVGGRVPLGAPGSRLAGADCRATKPPGHPVPGVATLGRHTTGQMSRGPHLSARCPGRHCA